MNPNIVSVKARLGLIAGIVVLSIALALLTSGCGSVLPSRKSESAAVKATESIQAGQSESLKHVVKGRQATPQQTELKIGGWGNEIDVTLPPPPPNPEPPRRSYHAGDGGVYVEETEYESKRSTAGGLKEDLRGALDVSIPMGVNLLLLAAGIIAVLYAIKAAKNSSASVKAAFNAADSVIANRIRAFRERVATTTDNAEMARLNAEIASLEAERGRLHRNGIA